MSARSEPVIGIDLGATACCVARFDADGRLGTIVNRAGELTTPSAVFFEGNSAVVGKEALKLALLEPNRLAEYTKREMGAGVLPRTVAGRSIAPEMVPALLLRRLKADTELKTGPVRSVVIAVPACFDHARREATVKAARLAGFENVVILNESTAAALAFDHHARILDETGRLAAEHQTRRKGVFTLVVYDLGGGAFDVTVLQFRDHSLKTLATRGDVLLGGRDWDQRIVDYAAARFLKEHPGDDPRKNPQTLHAVYQGADEAKRSLSERSKTRLLFSHHGRNVHLDLSRDKFEVLTHDLTERTAYLTGAVLEDAGLGWDRVDRVLLVGGPTRMPQVTAMLQDLSGQVPDQSLSPDEAVAHGTALYNAMFLAGRANRAEGNVKRFAVAGVNSHSLGVVSLDRASGRLMNNIVIPRNTPLPYTGSHRFTTLKPNQNRVVVRVVEGEPVDPDDCTEIGTCVIAPLPPDLPDRTAIRVKYAYDESGRLGIEASLEESGTPAWIEIVRGVPEVEKSVEDWFSKLLNRSDA